MSRYRRVFVVFRKELIDTLRDRRTLIAMVLAPIVLYPVLMVVLVEALRTEKTRRQSERYQVCVGSEEDRAWLEAVLKRDRQDVEATSAASDAEPESESLGATLRAEQIDVTALSDQPLWEAVQQQRFQAAVVMGLVGGGQQGPANRVVQIVYRDIDPRSDFVNRQLLRVLQRETDRIIHQRVAGLPGGAANLTPINAQSLSTAGPQAQFARTMAMVVPFLLVIMSVTGAMYPAIDLTAGERERGTLETLAVTPAPMGQIVAGKFGVVVAIAMLSTALNLGSMSAMVHFTRLDRLTADATSGASRSAATMQGDDSSAATIEPPEVGRILAENIERRRKLDEGAGHSLTFLSHAAPIVLLAMLPFAVLASAVMLAACSLARTFKEAQNYMMPVMMAAIIPAMVVSYMPTLKLEGLLLVLPVANVVVLIRDLFLGEQQITSASIVLLSTCFYAAAAVATAARLYAHEAVLFSDVSSYKTLLSRRLIQPRERPSAAAALLVLAALFPLNFYWQSYFIGLDAAAERARWVLAGSQVLVLAVPVLLVAWYFKLDLRRTFAWRPPSGLAIAGAILIGVAAMPCAALLQHVLAWLFPVLGQADDALRRQEALLTDGPAWAVLLTFALLPGLCEETLFRGFLLSGLREKLSPAATILCVGLLFGFFHVNLQKVPVVSLLGMLLAWIVLRGDSILPAMLVHVLHNGLGLAAVKFDAVARALGLSAELPDRLSALAVSRPALFAPVLLLGILLIRRRFLR